jgi:acetyl-CoA C-acetyltransferase
MTAPNTPVLIGAGQLTVRNESLEALSTPLDLMERATKEAATQCGLTPRQLSDVDALVVVKSFREPMRNSPEALANRLDISSAAQWLAPDGGNGPQSLVNLFARQIAAGQHKLVLLAGAEAMDNGRRHIKQTGTKPDWQVPSSADPELIFTDRPMCTAHEQAHGIWLAANVYPLFETALRGHYGNSIARHSEVLGDVFAPLSAVAASSPTAWFPKQYSPAEIAIPTESNRWVGWPYTKRMNAMNQVNQGAALILTSLANAQSLGVEPSAMVFLMGHADATERWFMSERVNYFSSPAIRRMGNTAFDQAAMTIDDIELLDLYSCFPSAVQIARDELGIAPNDARALTVTGGLPYHGGAGNNYVMNAIASMVARLRTAPGAVGLVTANGGYLSKHAAGIYSTRPPKRAWHEITASAVVWGDDDDEQAPALEETPQGDGVIETYTVAHNRDGEPVQGIIIGRLGNASNHPGARFLANTPPDRDLLGAMITEEFLGASGTVKTGTPTNTFLPTI